MGSEMCIRDREELDEMIAEIERMVADGSFMENSEPLDLDALAEEDPEMALSVAIQMGMLDAAFDEDGNLDPVLATQLSDEEEAQLRSVMAGRLRTGGAGRLN